MKPYLIPFFFFLVIVCAILKKISLTYKIDNVVTLMEKKLE